MAKRDHGGNLDAAMTQFGGAREDWIDLSTGINPVPYPVPDLPGRAWRDLPTKADLARLVAAAAARYCCAASILAVAGAQAAIQMVPHLQRPSRARVLAPTYNEHAASLRAAGWDVSEVKALPALAGADLAVLVNPNNPDGQRAAPGEVAQLAARCKLLIVDESFADPEPELSLAPQLGNAKNILVLRSFGKFYGLAGLRLGFVLGSADLIGALQEMAGPWPVSGAAIEIGTRALLDEGWADKTTARLAQDTARLDALAQDFGWRVAGGTTLFRLFETPGSIEAQRHLAEHHIWSRIFPWSPTLLRLGLPGPADAWQRLEAALR